MARVQLKEEADVGLEIIAIGSLYSGRHWDKKYWSCSRGKDRYPYPVGYQAVRAYNGIKYKMEIHEGPKGPLFLITSMDGCSFSGQTPDIAWDMLQKKGCLNMKILHGKRSSCKVDGVERLLRELVANVSGTAEPNLLTSNLCKNSSGSALDHQSPDECENSDLLSCLGRPKIKGKRSRRHELETTKVPVVANLKRTRTRRLKNNSATSKLSSSVSVDEGNQSFPDKHEKKRSIDISLTSDEKNDIEKPMHAEEEDAVAKNSKSTQLARNLSIDENPHGRLPMDTLSDICQRMEPDNNTRDAPSQKDCTNVEDNHHAASDTLGLTQVIFEPAPDILEKNNLNQTENLTASDMVLSEGSKESHSEEICSLNTNTGSEKNDFDSVGQDMVKSMMTFLLPQAIPLLEKTSGKKKTTTSILETLPCDGNTTDILHMEDEDRERQKNMHAQDVDCKSATPSELTKCVVLDSLEDEQYCERDNIKGSFSCIPHVGQATAKEDSKPTDSCREVCGSVHNELLVYPVEATGSKKSCNNETGTGQDLKGTCREDQNANDSNVRGILACSEPLIKEITTKKEVAGNAILPSSQGPSLVYSRRRAQNVSHIAREYNCSPLENDTTSCPGKHFGAKRSPITKSSLASSTNLMSFLPENQGKDLVSEPTVAEDHPGFCSEKSTMQSEARIEKMHPCGAILDIDETVLRANKNDCDSGLSSKSVCRKQLEACDDKEMIEQKNLLRTNNYKSSHEMETNFDNYGMISHPHCNVELYREAEGMSKIVGCYLHPMRVLSVFLSNIESVIYICVLCGFLEDKYRRLFTYRVEVKEPRAGCPSFSGHTTVMLPVLKDYLGKEIAVEQTGFQFSPDGSYLVLIGSIRTPFCRTGNITCSCSACTSVKFEDEESGMKIVQVKNGYVSVMTRLNTADAVHGVLTFESDHLVAVGRSGRLHLWVMDSTWSKETERYSIPSEDCISPNLVEIKKIPERDNLIVGHNGLGEFSLWDISKRALMLSFFSSSTSVNQFFPISLFSWNKRGNLCSDYNLSEHVNELLDATNNSSKSSEECASPQLKDTAIWIFASTESDTDISCSYLPTGCQKNQDGLWKLALLADNMVSFGAELDSRASAIGASVGRGIIGTHDGLVYVWDLSTGNKLGTLLHFKGASVSCIATDNSETGVVAVAADARLMVYLLSSDGKYIISELQLTPMK